jgi:hypothetical protein
MMFRCCDSSTLLTKSIFVSSEGTNVNNVFAFSSQENSKDKRVAAESILVIIVPSSRKNKGGGVYPSYPYNPNQTS